MKKNETPYSSTLVSEVRLLLQRDTPPAVIKKAIGKSTGFKKTKCQSVYNEIIKNLESGAPLPVSKVEETAWEDDLIFEKPYFFNEKTRQYIVFLKRAAKNIVVKEETHKAILEAYSNWDSDSRSINDICRTFRIPRAYLEEYLKIFGITHDSLPITDEELESKPESEIIESLREKKQWSVLQKYEKKSWQETLEKAKKWDEFNFNVASPFESALRNFSFTKKNFKPFKAHKPSNKHILINIADIHVGLKAEARYMYFKDNWNTEMLQESMRQYSEKVAETLAERTYKFDSATVCLGGDICHTLSGFTDKGTPIEYEHIGETQLDYAFTILLSFFENILELFPKIDVKAVQGNHSSLGDYAVAKFLETYYRNEERMNFDITTKRFLPFKISDVNLFILEHGYSAKYKSRLPRAGAARDSYIHNILLARPDLLQGVKNKYYITNDQHHLEVQERAQYEMILCPSIVNGDRHSDNSVLNARPRQNIFCVDNTGIKELIHVTFD